MSLAHDYLIKINNRFNSKSKDKNLLRGMLFCAEKKYKMAYKVLKEEASNDPRYLGLLRECLHYLIIDPSLTEEICNKYKHELSGIPETNIPILDI